MAPPKRPRLLGAEAALAQVVAAHDAMRAAEAERAKARQRRAEAIARSLELGLTLNEIGRHLGGVSVERVRQMRAVK